VIKLSDCRHHHNICVVLVILINSISDTDKHTNIESNISYSICNTSRSRIWINGIHKIEEYMHKGSIDGFINRMDYIVPTNTRQYSNMKLITGIKYKGNSSTLFQEGILYCSPSNAGNIKDPIYSAISFFYNGNLCYGLLLAAVSIKQGNPNNNNINNNILLHIAILEIDDIDIPDYWPFLRLKFQFIEGSQLVNIVCCYIDNLVDHLFIYPDFIEPLSSLTSTTLDSSERYWLIGRNFFDRREIDIAPMFCETFMANNVHDAKIFLSDYQTDGIPPYNEVSKLPNYPYIVGLHSQSVVDE
jgi:hypothetical protein